MSGQQQSLIHLSNSEINNLLNVCGIAVEFTGVDSPVHRQQLAAYDDSFSNFPSYVKDATEGLQEYVRACRDFREANHKIAKIIKGTGDRLITVDAFSPMRSQS